MRSIPALFVVLLAISSCGGKSDAAPGPTKSLFSAWANDDGTEVIDLTGGQMGSGQSFGYQLTSGEACLCSAAFGGTEANATAVLTGCAYIGGGGGVDPGCAALDGSYTLAISGVKLTLCKGGSCGGYH